MAIDITVNLTDEREATLVTLAAKQNELFPQNPLTPAQLFRQFTRDWLDQEGRQLEEARRLGLRSAYSKATPEEQATIDAILDQYR